MGEPRPGSLAVDATVEFTEDVGGSEILYLASSGTPLVTVLGASSDLLAQVATGRLRVSVLPEDLIVFDANTKVRIGRGVGVRRG